MFITPSFKVKLRNTTVTGHSPKHRVILFRSKCYTAIFCIRCEPGKACQIIMACIVLHNIAVTLRLPMPYEDEHPADVTDLSSRRSYSASIERLVSRVVLMVILVLPPGAHV